MSSADISAIFAAHPAPWRHVTLPGVIRNGMGEVQVRDSLGREVPLFTIIALVTHISQRAASNATAAAATAAHQPGQSTP